jgi:anti-anti-sigma factor
MPSNARKKAPTNGGTSKRPDEFAPLRIAKDVLPGGLLLFRVQGELELANAEQLAEAVLGPLEPDAAKPQPGLDGSAPKVVVDLGRCSFIDSTGLATLLRIARRLQSSDGTSTLAVVEGQLQVRRLFEVTRLEGKLHVFHTRDDAIASLGPVTR